MSKTNIRMSKPQYIVDEVNKEITCTILAHSSTKPFHFLFLDLLANNNLGKKVYKRFGISRISSGKAFTVTTKCHPEDKWNETIGKRIAESKCKRQIYEFYYRLYDYIINEILHNDISLLNQYTDNLGYCINREAKHLKELMYGTEKISNT